MIRALIVVCLTFVYILFIGTPILIYAFVTKNDDLLYRVGVSGTRLALWLSGVRLEVSGLEKAPKDRAVVFMANHQSNCDPPAILAVLPRVRVLVKKEFFRVPILGRGMLGVGFIPVDRRQREQALKAVERALAELKQGHSFMIFPEGTRSPDGRMQLFKKGGFVMAIEAGVPIVPVSISGSAKIMRKGEAIIRPGTVRITFHEAVPTAGYTTDKRDIIMQKVRELMMQGLTEAERPQAR